MIFLLNNIVFKCAYSYTIVRIIYVRHYKNCCPFRVFMPKNLCRNLLFEGKDSDNLKLIFHILKFQIYIANVSEWRLKVVGEELELHNSQSKQRTPSYDLRMTNFEINCTHMELRNRFSCVNACCYSTHTNFPSLPEN
jgi:hypothetical protein